MAPAVSSSNSELVLPASLIGRLIGRGGTTIQELERLSGCRVRVPRREGSSRSADGQLGPQEGEEELVSISVRSVASRTPADAEVCEGRCLRAAQLLCVEGLNLDAALAQADAEKQAQEQVEAANWKESQTKMAMRRILLNWPQFDDVDVREALREACDDEDEAVDMLLGGYRAPRVVVQPVLEPRAREPVSQPVAREAFPSLLTNPAASAKQARGFALKGGASSWTKAASHRRHGVAPSCPEAFPGLPEPSQKPAARASTLSTRTLRQSCQRQRRQQPQTICRRQ